MQPTDFCCSFIILYNIIFILYALLFSSLHFSISSIFLCFPFSFPFLLFSLSHWCVYVIAKGKAHEEKRIPQLQGPRKQKYLADFYWGIWHLSPGWDLWRTIRTSSPQRPHRETSFNIPGLKQGLNFAFLINLKDSSFGGSGPFWQNLDTLVLIWLRWMTICNEIIGTSFAAQTMTYSFYFFFFSGQDPDPEQFSFPKNDKTGA